jgi:cysteine desulfurase family protein (TIGR01976 family)
MSDLDVAACRAQFPALSRTIAGRPVVYFDGPAGSQVPGAVVDAIKDYLFQHNANHGGAFLTSRENDALLHDAQQAAADFVGASDYREIVFGANMTTLTFAFSRALAQTWGPGDEIIVTDLDHDGNVTPWVLAAKERGVTVKSVRVRVADCTLDLFDFQAKMSAKTRLVAVGCASNAVGTINPLRAIFKMAHEAGAEVFLDAVHYAPHALIDVAAWGCDYLVCSAYKFFGPHVGLLWGRRQRLEELTSYKLRPSSNDCPDRWMTGTPNFESIAGVRAAIDYLAGLGEGIDRRARLNSAFSKIGSHERELGARLLQGLTRIPGIDIVGIPEMPGRVPTVSIRHRKHSPRAVAEHLDRNGIFVWHGNFYALRLSETLGLEPDGMVRIGLLHYNTAEEVDRLLEALGTLSIH